MAWARSTWPSWSGCSTSGAAWRSTWAVLRAVGIGMLIELATAVLMLGTWTVGVLLT